MAEKSLSLMQQIALLPAGIPDSILDFLEDYQNPEQVFSKESVKASLMPDYFASQQAAIQQQLLAQRNGLGKVTALRVDPAKDVQQGFVCRLTFGQSTRGLGFVVHPQEGRIRHVVITAKDYSEEEILGALRAVK